MDLLRIPELFVAYLDFLLDFAVRAHEALRPYAGAGRLDDTLFLYLLAGATTAYFLILIADRVGLKPDRDLVQEHYGPFAATLLASDLDSKVVPLVTVFLIFPAAILFHLSTEVGALVSGLLLDRSWALTGTVRDTINAAFAFGAFFLPIWATTIILITWRARGETEEGKPQANYWISAGIVAAVIFAYFPLALHGTHTGMTYGRAFFAFVSGMGGWVIIPLIFLSALVGILRILLRAGRSAAKRISGPRHR